MANIKSRLKIRASSAAAWASANPVLLAGEPGFELDTRRLRFGDGVSPFASLPSITLNTTGYQVLNAVLTSLAALGSAANRGLYFSGANTLAEFDLPAAARSFLSAGSSQSALRSALGLFGLSNLDTAIIRTAVEGMALDLTDDDELPTVKAVADWVNAKIPIWAAVAGKNRSVDVTVNDLNLALKPNYRYRIEGRFVSKSNTSGVLVEFQSSTYSLTIPLGVASNSYDFQLTFDNFQNSSLIRTFEAVVGIAGSAIATANRHQWTLSFGAFPNNTGSYPVLTDVKIPFDLGQSWDGGGNITIYEKPII
jgi:hypothetical protein